jgi:hypothetical protein
MSYEDALIERCCKLLETKGREPREWPVPISRDDLEELLHAYCVAYEECVDLSAEADRDTYADKVVWVTSAGII